MKFSKKETVRIYRHLVQKSRKFLQSPQCREFLFFLFFVFIAATFWTLQTLNEEYETEISIPLRMKGVPDNVMFTSELPKELNLTLADKGTVLVNYMLGQGLMPITLDFNEYKQKSNHIRILSTELEKKIVSQLVLSTKIIDITPDTLEAIYTQGEGKKIPVRIKGHVSTKPQYYITQQEITPDSVMVYAPKNILDTIHEAYTQEIDLTEIADTMNFTIPLEVIKGVKYVPHTTNIRFCTDILTEKTVSVPIAGIDFPSDKQLKTFPSKTHVTFQVGMSHFKEIEAKDFVIGVSFDTLSTEIAGDHCELKIYESPVNANHIRLSPSKVEYLIEQKQ